MHPVYADLSPQLRDEFSQKILTSSHSIYEELRHRYEKTHGGVPDGEFYDRWLMDMLHDEMETLEDSDVPLALAPDRALRLSLLTHAERILEAADQTRCGRSDLAFEMLCFELDGFRGPAQFPPWAVFVQVDLVTRLLPLANARLEDFADLDMELLSQLPELISTLPEEGVPCLLIPALVLIFATVHSPE